MSLVRTENRNSRGKTSKSRVVNHQLRPRLGCTRQFFEHLASPFVTTQVGRKIAQCNTPSRRNSQFFLLPQSSALQEVEISSHPCNATTNFLVVAQCNTVLATPLLAHARFGINHPRWFLTVAARQVARNVAQCNMCCNKIVAKVA